MYFDINYGMNEICYLSYICLLCSALPLRRSPLLYFEGFRQHFYDPLRGAVPVQASPSSAPGPFREWDVTEMVSEQVGG